MKPAKAGLSETNAPLTTQEVRRFIGCVGFGKQFRGKL